MTLTELQQRVDIALESNLSKPDAQVVVQMNEPGIPTHPMVGVKDASLGFDWTHGKFIITCDQPVVRKEKKKH